jgi:hypothetical protein
MPIASLFGDISRMVTEKPKTLPQWLFGEMGSSRDIAPYTPKTMLTASKVHNLCPRYETIRADKDIYTMDVVRPELQWIFDVGKLYHSLYRDCYMGPRGVFYGKWKCAACNWNTDGLGTDDELDSNGRPLKSFLPEGFFPNPRPLRLVSMPHKCGECGASRRGIDYTVSGREVEDDNPLIVFDEWLMVNEEYGLRAKSDGWRMVQANRTMRNQEVKSISPTGFKYVKRHGAKPEHKTQSMICTWMSGMKIGEVVYLCKAAWEYPDDFIYPAVVKLDMEWMNRHVFEPVMTMRECLATGRLASRICKTEHDKMAKECDLKVVCFKEGGN